MATTTTIEWCDHTASPWHGCGHALYLDADGNEHEHPGCLNCYAEAGSVRNPGTLGVWGKDGTRVKSKSFIGNLRRWNKAAAKAGRVVSVFPSICDPFEDRPELVPWREEMFTTIDQCPNVRLLLLTKRPENIRRMWPEHIDHGPRIEGRIERYLRNVWLLTSVSNQPTADAMLPEISKCRDLSPVLGVSAEPLLGPVDLFRYVPIEPQPPLFWAEQNLLSGWMCDKGRHGCGPGQQGGKLMWLIIGGESGHGARPCNIAHVRSLVKQCRVAGVAPFVKQLGAHVIDHDTTSASTFPEEQCWPAGTKTDGHRVLLRDPKGGDPAEWPEDTRVREWPQ